jgi:hypothetical protein
LLDGYYRGDGSGFTEQTISDYYENASCLRKFDFDGDGDLDLFVGNESVSNNFGATPKSHLLLNDKGDLKPVQPSLFENLGMVTDAAWSDYNHDGSVDLVVVGEWMEPTFLKNNRGTFEKDQVVTEVLSGLWQSISAFDIDGDGDKDFILGNWGLNSKFKASASAPLKMYYSDFDENGQAETIVAIEKGGSYYPFEAFDRIASQIVSLRKKFTSYQSFAGKRIEDIFTTEQLKKAKVYNVQQLASGYLVNDKGTFKFVSFPLDLQVSPILAQLPYDFDSDGKEEVLLGGNYFGVQPIHGRYGSFSGAIVKGEKNIMNTRSMGLDLFNQSVRHFNIIPFKGEQYLLVTINNGKARTYKLLR